MSVAEYQAYNAGTKIFTLEENVQAFNPGNNMTSLRYAAEEISKFLVESGLIKQAPNLNQIFDDRFIKAYAAKQKS